MGENTRNMDCTQKTDGYGIRPYGARLFEQKRETIYLPKQMRLHYEKNFKFIPYLKVFEGF